MAQVPKWLDYVALAGAIASITIWLAQRSVERFDDED